MQAFQVLLDLAWLLSEIYLGFAFRRLELGLDLLLQSQVACGFMLQENLLKYRSYFGKDTSLVV